jgi:hypothetical protein
MDHYRRLLSLEPIFYVQPGLSDLQFSRCATATLKERLHSPIGLHPLRRSLASSCSRRAYTVRRLWRYCISNRVAILNDPYGRF